MHLDIGGTAEARSSELEHGDWLNVRGQAEPEIVRVCQDVYGIVEKMLNANQAIGAFSRYPQFEFHEVLFILTILGALVDDHQEGDSPTVDLWISES